MAPTVRRYVATQKVTVTPRERIKEIPWTKPGPVIVSESPQMRPSANVTFDGFSVNLTHPFGGTVSVELRKNGIAIAVVTVDSGVPYAHKAISPGVGLIGRVDSYSVAVTAVAGSPTELSGSIEIGGGSDSPQGGGPGIG